MTDNKTNSYQRQWLSVFQLLPGRIISTIVTLIVYGVVCPFSNTQRNVLLVINVFNTFQTVLCIMALMRTYMRLRPYLQGHIVLAKAGVFKGIIFLQAIQRVVFSGLLGHHVLKPTGVVSYMDWAAGIPDFVTVCEMFLLCWLFILPYSSAPFRPEERSSSSSAGGEAGQGPAPAKRRPFFVALLDCFNPMDIVRGFLFTFRLRDLVNGQRSVKPAPRYRTASEIDNMRHTRDVRHMRETRNMRHMSEY
jgi:hypothetical protein